MIPCAVCGERIKPSRMVAHMATHNPVQVIADEVYWRGRISQEILGERIAAEAYPQARTASPHYIEGLDAAIAIAQEGL